MNDLSQPVANSEVGTGGFARRAWQIVSVRARVRDRSLWAWASAPFRPRHYRVLFRAGRIDPALRFIWRYLSQTGTYPWQPRVTLAGRTVAPMLYSRHDLLTLCEVMLREDYRTSPPALRVLDIGANIGISALYFLASHPQARVLCYEPSPANLPRLRRNLEMFGTRAAIVAAAVWKEPGSVRFAMEATGRYGHVASAGDTDVDAESVAQAWRRACDFFAPEAPDLVKLDVEGAEEVLVEALRQLAPGVIVLYEDAAGVHRTFI